MRLMQKVKALAAAALLIAAPAGAQEEAPLDVINGAIDAIKSGLADNRDAYEADEAALIAWVDSLLAPRFDRNYAGRLVLAKHWRKASTDQKRRFIAGFYSALLNRYATGILEFQEDRVKVLPMRGEPKKGRAQVFTEVTLDDGSEIAVNYGLVQRGDAGWKVYDVTIDGISYVRNFRTEIDEEIGRSSLDAVIERLEAEAQSGDAGEAAADTDEAA